MKKIVLLMVGILLSSAFVRADDDYRVGPEDVLEAIVWKQPDFSHTLTVSPTGTISYPLLGDIKVGDLTIKEIEQIIREKLSAEYIQDPKVGVVLKEANSRKVFIFGEVRNPGVFKITTNLPVLELIYKAGGLTDKAGKNLVINRKQKASAEEKEKNKISSTTEAVKVDLDLLFKNGDLSQNIAVLPGDMIYIRPKSESIIYVLGEVKNPGPYKMEGDVTLLAAVKLAGGFTDSAAREKIEVRRESAGQQKKILINIVEIERKGKLSQDILLQPGDIVTTPASWF